MGRQLYRTHSIDVPYSAIRLPDVAHVDFQHIPVCPFVYWPSGKPCDPVNMFLLDIAHLTTGETLVTYAAELSHLIRHCARKGVRIDALSDMDIFEISSRLQEEKRQGDADKRIRNNNTVRVIISSIIRFLQWYQENFVSPLRSPLIGEAPASPKIIVEFKRISGRGKSHFQQSYYSHRAMPEWESRDPKHPIARPVIEAIERCIDEKSIEGDQSPYFSRTYKNIPDLLRAQLEYLRARRHFMLWLMKRVGLRPAEMVGISIEKNKNIIRTKKIIIPTKKRRREIAPDRAFLISIKDAATFQRYLIAREKYCRTLKEYGVGAGCAGTLFVGNAGEPIKKSSLERDFSRLVKATGMDDVQACFSMFRHRFITYEVIVHLKEFLSNSDKTRQMVTDTEYEMILHRVARKTGHGSARSLWHYIDLAWKEIDVWGNVDIAIERFHAADRLFDDLLALDHEIKTMDTSPETRAVVKTIADRLSAIISSARHDLNALKDAQEVSVVRASGGEPLDSTD
ncbi:Tyrosine recombinase XerC [Ralstonia wenshanensis]|uniref:Tyrosine recombinase XerC n=2 Tax=Ralstonia wenshanensis TaxID=2842456 RepID=A0AAD2EP75_9RALS|nr:Tyrosine recombinase XerC [Ralstonia wenshanensis]